MPIPAEKPGAVDRETGGRSQRIVSIQRWSIALLITGGALNYIDRATLSVANKLIQDELGIPVGKMGLLLSAFLWAYALAQLPVGGLIDRYGPRKLLGLGLFSWSIAQAAGGFVTSFGMFIAARFALGVGEAPDAGGRGRRQEREGAANDGRGHGSNIGFIDHAEHLLSPAGESLRRGASRSRHIAVGRARMRLSRQKSAKADLAPLPVPRAACPRPLRPRPRRVREALEAA